MNLHEQNLKKIMKEIEKYGIIKDVQVSNSSLIICPPKNKEHPESRITEVDFNRAKEFVITFKMGDTKQIIP